MKAFYRHYPLLLAMMLSWSSGFAAHRDGFASYSALPFVVALFWGWFYWEQMMESDRLAAKSALPPARRVSGATYHCGHCGYEGPCYGNGYSAPWCRQCQMNDRLTLIP